MKISRQLFKNCNLNSLNAKNKLNQKNVEYNLYMILFGLNQMLANNLNEMF